MPTLMRHVALVTESAVIGPGDTMTIAAALQKQASRDLAPLWEVSATVDAFGGLDEVPTDYWPMIIRDNIQAEGLAGVHKAGDGQPFALVMAFGGDLDMVSLTASHELMEMLVDPSGERWMAGPCPDPGQGRVNFLVEVSDPCLGRDYAYSVNGVWVSDFYTPRYFDPVAAAGVRYSYTGALERPRQVLPGGYLTWRNLTDGRLYQQSWFEGSDPVIQSVPYAAGVGNVRSQVDAATAGARHARNRRLVARLRDTGGRKGQLEASAARAAQLHAQVDGLVAGAPTADPPRTPRRWCPWP